MPYIRKKTKIILKDVYIYVKINGKEIGTKMKKTRTNIKYLDTSWILNEIGFRDELMENKR